MGATGNGSRQPEPMGDHLSKRLAVQLQNDLDEYMVANPEFPVGCSCH